jgi:hypothetical protein
MIVVIYVLLVVLLLYIAYLQYQSVADTKRFMEIVEYTNKRIDLLEAKDEEAKREAENEQ